MASNKTGTQNITLIKLKGTPFKTGKELKAQEELILLEEWQAVERARVRRNLLMKAENKMILAPLLNGFRAKFTPVNSEHENTVRVYLTDDDSIQVDLDKKLMSHDVDDSIERIVRSLLSGIVSGYLATLGLKNEPGLGAKSIKRANKV